MRQPSHFGDFYSFSLIRRAFVYVAMCMARARKASHDELNGENISDMVRSGNEQEGFRGEDSLDEALE